MSCRKKSLSKINAKIALMDIQRKDKGAKRIYYCQSHKGWHITSKPKKNEIRNTEKRNTPIVESQTHR